MRKLALLATSCFLSSFILAQIGLEPLPNSPVASWRHDDVWFVNEQVGWICNVDGEIWKTEDGGDSWTQQADQATSFRCITFADELNGWAGNLGPGGWAPTSDSNVIYSTYDGGLTWNPAENITGPAPQGICGIQAVDDIHVYAVGRWLGPPYFMRTTDGGNTWDSQDLSDLCNELIDLKFFTPDSGFIAGGDGNGHAVLYLTTDGGDSFEEYYETEGAHFWKMEYNSDTFGYVSVWDEQNDLPSHYIKTMDGGVTWEDVQYHPNYYYAEGIGFANDTLGWVGGGSSTRQTTDGGETWTTVTIDPTYQDYMNRFRFVNDNCMYAVGSRVYKYSAPIVTNLEDAEIPELSLSCDPNPFSGQAVIKFGLPSEMHVELSVHDMGGRRVATLVDEIMPAGKNQQIFRLPHDGAGSFVVALKTPQAKRVITIIATE